MPGDLNTRTVTQVTTLAAPVPLWAGVACVGREREMNWNHSAALACYLDLADLPVGTTYVTDVRSDRTVYLVMAWPAQPTKPGWPFAW